MLKSIYVTVLALFPTLLIVSMTSALAEIIQSANELSSRVEIPCIRVEHRKLQAGSQCMTTVKADLTENDVGLKIDIGEEYIFSFPGNQEWYDASQANVAPHGSSGTFLMNLFAFLKRHLNSDWFALIAELNNANESCSYDLSLASNLTAKTSGMLLLYANDARGFYWNNSGEITVTVTRAK